MSSWALLLLVNGKGMAFSCQDLISLSVAVNNTLLM